jgi:hypothetical protein
MAGGKLALMVNRFSAHEAAVNNLSERNEKVEEYFCYPDVPGKRFVARSCNTRYNKLFPLSHLVRYKQNFP